MKISVQVNTINTKTSNQEMSRKLKKERKKEVKWETKLSKEAKTQKAPGVITQWLMAIAMTIIIAELVW